MSQKQEPPESSCTRREKCGNIRVTDDDITELWKEIARLKERISELEGGQS